MPRRDYDFYETPPHYVAALFEQWDIRGRVLEPCVGDHAIAKYLVRQPGVTQVYTNDIDPTRHADQHADACDPDFWRVAAGYAWIVSNTPFSHINTIAPLAVATGCRVALLARLSFLEPTEDRESFWEAHPPSQVIVLPRYSFRTNDAGKRATDNVTCAWCVWNTDVRITTIYSRPRSFVAAARLGMYD